MTDKSKLNEKLMKEFEQKMIVAQDVQRGISESRITEIEAAMSNLNVH